MCSIFFSFFFVNEVRKLLVAVTAGMVIVIGNFLKGFIIFARSIFYDQDTIRGYPYLIRNMCLLCMPFPLISLFDSRNISCIFDW